VLQFHIRPLSQHNDRPGAAQTRDRGGQPTKGETMSRIFGNVAIVSVVVLSLMLADNASAAPKTVVGTVGPGFTITLKLSGSNVTKLKAGVQYRFVINDRASIHDFHLLGPGISKVITSVDFTGTKSITLTLKKGTYTFRCDPHQSFMHGSFKVA
jgi:plastocyanin